MSAHSRRRARLLRVRVVTHRIAAVHLAQAEGACAELVRVTGRLTDLRETIVTTRGACSGVDLQGSAELTDRLEQAHGRLVAKLLQEQVALEARKAIAIAAHRAKDRMADAHRLATIREDVAHEVTNVASPRPRCFGLRP